MAGKWKSANQSAYNTTKHAVVGLSKCVALEAAPFGNSVNTVCPGMVETDMIQNFEIHADIAGVGMDELMKAVCSKFQYRNLCNLLRPLILRFIWAVKRHTG